MKRYFWLAILVLLATSCAGAIAPPELKVKQERAPEAVPEEESADTECSYFYFLWGNTAAANGTLDEAQESYEKALVCDPAADGVMRRLASLLVRMGKQHEAITWMEKVIALHPADNESRFWLAQIYAMMNRYEEAVVTYQAILTDDPANLDAMLYLGALHASKREYEKAREMLEQLVRLDDQSFGGHKYLARLYREMRLFDKAAVAYNQALELGWSVPLALEAGEVLEQQGRLEESIALYQQVLDEDETNDQARQRLVGLFLQADRADAALAELEELRRSSTEPYKIDFTIGRILLDSGRLDEAIAKFNSILAVDQGQDGARYMLALGRLKNKERGKAKEQLLKIPADAKMYEEAITLLVRILLDEKDYAAMEQVLKARLEAPATRKPRFYALLASVYHQQGKNDQGKEVFRLGLAAFPGDANLMFEYGIFLDSTGDHEAALAKMEEVLKIEPDHAVALNFLGYTWADHGVNLDKALEYIQRAVTLRPEDGFIRDSLGWVFFKMGQFERARQELEAALALAPDDPTLNEHLGDALHAVGATEKARGQYERALALFGEEESKEKVRNKIKELAP